MEQPKITCYLKPTCGWSEGVRAVLRKYGLEWEEKDVINNPEHRAEMIERSGQMLQPCVEVNGNMLADVSGDEVEAWMLANNVVSATCKSTESVGLVTAAMPPCAYWVFASARCFLVMIATRPCGATLRANVSPAMPLPMTM